MKNKISNNRTCIVTGESFPKDQMIRIVRIGNSKFEIDLIGNKHGRGSYIKKSRELIPLLKKQKCLNRSFKTQVPTEIYDELEKELIKYE